MTRYVRSALAQSTLDRFAHRVFAQSCRPQRMRWGWFGNILPTGWRSIGPSILGSQSGRQQQQTTSRCFDLKTENQRIGGAPTRRGNGELFASRPHDWRAGKGHRGQNSVAGNKARFSTRGRQVRINHPHACWLVLSRPGYRSFVCLGRSEPRGAGDCFGRFRCPQ